MQTLSHHANNRCANRSIPNAHIALAFDWGKAIRQPNRRTAYHLGHREARCARRQGILIPERAIGTIVIEADDGCIVTTIRSQDRHRLVIHGRQKHHRRC
jgi:hypothetical protein